MRHRFVRNLLRPQGHHEELIKALPRKLIKAPPRAYLVSGTVHLSDLKEGLNRRGARDLVNSNSNSNSDSDATATRQQRDGDQTA